MNVTQHFALWEFASHDGEPYPISRSDGDATWLQTRLKPLCDALEIIRAECGGRPISIISGYRSEAHNARLRSDGGDASGVARNSQHVQGRAVDFSVRGLKAKDVAAVVDRLLAEGRLPMIGGRGRYPAWCHIDVRAKAENCIARWDGEGFGSEPVA